MSARAQRAWLPRFGVGFALALCIAVGGTVALTDALGLEAGQHPLQVAVHLEAGLERLRASREATDVYRVAYLGDSTVFANAAGNDLPRALQREIERAHTPPPRIDVHNLAYPAMGAFAYYFMADRIAEAAPDLVVWETSFTHVAPRWRTNVRPGLAGFVEARRIPEALGLKLGYIGLTADRLLLARAIVTLGWLDAWRALGREQSKVARLRSELEGALLGWTGGRPEARFRRRTKLDVKAAILVQGHKPQRYTARAELDHYGDALTGLSPEHPALLALDRGLARLARDGIETLVYLNPINVEHLSELGVLDADELARSSAIYRGIAERHGADFLDLHELLPDRYFLDAPGHFVSSEELNGPAKLASVLSPAVLRRAVGANE